MLFLKAQIRGANTPDLFATPVQVKAHVAHGHLVGPYIAIRHKAPPEVQHTKAVIVHAHPAPMKPTVVDNTAEAIWRQGALEDPPGAPPAPTRNFGWDAVKLSNAYSTDELQAMYRVLARDPAGHNPEHASGKSIQIYTPSTRKKMDAITWAITYHMKEKNHAPSGNRDGSFKDEPKYKAPDDGPPMVFTTTPQVDIKAEAQRKAQAKKLRDAADKIIAAGEDSLNRDRLSNTRKRAGQAASAINDAQKEIQLGETMRNLAAAIESGDAGPALSAVTSRAGLEMLTGKLRGAMYLADRGLSYGEQQKREGRPPSIEDVKHAKVPKLLVHRSNISDLTRELEQKAILRKENPGLVAELNAIQAASGEDDMLLPIPEDLANRVLASFDSAGQSHAGWQLRDSLADIKRYRKMGITTDVQLQDALAELIQYRTGKRAEDPIKAAERALVGTRPGIDFFPTPPPLAQRMVQLANIQPGERVLEPSAGKGDIADAIRAAGGKVDTVELSDTLRKVLEAKGHALVGTDFEAFDSHDHYDAIVMNPPWSGGADVRHVMRAYGMLKPGGRLVALMSNHASFAQDKQSQAFRAFLEEQGVASEKLPASDFASQWMSGGIPSWLIKIEKPMGKALFFKAAA